MRIKNGKIISLGLVVVACLDAYVLAGHMHAAPACITQASSSVGSVRLRRLSLQKTCFLRQHGGYDQVRYRYMDGEARKGTGVVDGN